MKALKLGMILLLGFTLSSCRNIRVKDFNEDMMIALETLKSHEFLDIRVTTEYRYTPIDEPALMQQYREEEHYQIRLDPLYIDLNSLGHLIFEDANGDYYRTITESECLNDKVNFARSVLIDSPTDLNLPIIDLDETTEMKDIKSIKTKMMENINW